VQGVTVSRGGSSQPTNTAVGSAALVSNTSTGTFNTAVGYQAAFTNTIGDYNTAVGYSTLFLNVSGDRNTAIGAQASYTNNKGSSNTAVGNSALYSNNGDSNTAIGDNSLQFHTVGDSNTAVGMSSLINNQTGSGNTVVGAEALYEHTAGDRNTVVGFSTFVAGLTGSSNVVIGYNASSVNVLSADVQYIDNSVIIGTATKPLSVIGTTNSIVIGNTAEGMGSNTAVLGNDSITNTYLKGTIQLHRTAASPFNYERLAMRWNGLIGTIGTSNLGSGLARDLVFETNGLERARITAGGLFTADGIAVGRGGGNGLTNTAVGSGALVNNFNYASDNTAIGYRALSANREGGYNTAIGSATLFFNTIGGDNSVVGSNALYSNTTGSYNSVVGSNALYSNTTGNHNIAMGYSSLVSSVTGSNNVAIGSYAGDSILGGALVTDLNNSILIGANTKPLSARGNTNSIVIGEGARGKGSNTVVLGNDSITNTYLKGDIGIGADTFLVRDGAANTLALRNSTNTQTLNLYSTYSDSSSYQRLRITPSLITSEGSGSGAQGTISINGSFVYLLPGTPTLTTNRLVVSSAGNVGIGISTGSGAGAAPVVGTGKLNVNGDIESTNASGGIILVAAGTSNRVRVTLNPTGNGLIFTPL
jgi:hypothetical protein